MEDSDFLDLIYSQWAKTTGSEDMFWMYEGYIRGYDTVCEVYAVGRDEEKHFVASFNADEDADFITAVHGCFPDLVRRMRAALDEAERLDAERDEQEVRIAQLEMQIDELNKRLLSYGNRLKEEEATVEGLAIENRQLESWLDNGGPDAE